MTHYVIRLRTKSVTNLLQNFYYRQTLRRFLLEFNYQSQGFPHYSLIHLRRIVEGQPSLLFQFHRTGQIIYPIHLKC